MVIVAMLLNISTLVIFPTAPAPLKGNARVIVSFVKEL